MSRVRAIPWNAILAFVLPLCVYLGPARYQGSGDTEPAELLPISLIRQGNLDFDEFVTTPDVPYSYRRVNGRVVSAYPIVPGLLNVPIYWIAHSLGVDLYARRFLLSLITTSLIAALSTLFLFLGLTRICESRREALFFALVAAFATCLWSVASRGMWQHGPSLLFLSCALWLLLTGEERKVALAGLLLGLAVVNRPTNLLIALPIALFVLRHRGQRFTAFLALAAIPFLLASLYSTAYLGTPFSLGQDVPRGAFNGNIAAGLVGLLFSPSRGLFLFSPIFLFSVAGGVLAYRFKAEGLFRYLAVAALLVLLLSSRWGMWWGGVSFGYRLLIELVPILILFLALAWKYWIRESPALKAAFFALVGWSVYVQILGAFVYPTEFNQNIDLETARLWDIHDSELLLCTKKLFGKSASIGSTSSVPFLWWSPEKNDDAIPGWLDSSPGGKLVRGPLEISGWAKSITGEVDVRVVLDRQVAVPERFARPDVASVLPQLGDTSRAGFRAMFRPPLADQPSDHRLAVEFRDPKGGVRRLGPIRFRWRR